MKKSEAIDRAVEFVRKRGSARTPEIAAHLGISTVRISSMLWPACRSGRLVSCHVEQPGKPPCNEYRIGAGQPQAGMTPMQTYRQRGAAAVRRDQDAEGVANNTIARCEQQETAAIPDGATIVPQVRIDAELPRARWALTSEGTFIQLGTPHPIEIPSASARGLVDFIRRLDAAEV